jgi:hypothetical protein
MQALLEEMPVGWGQVANLGGTCVREWLSPKAFGWPARTAAGRILTRRNLMFAALAYSLDGVSRITAARFVGADVTIPDSLQDDLAVWILFPLLLRVVLAGTFRTKLVLQTRFGDVIARYHWLSRLGDWEVVLWLVMVQACAVVRYALPVPLYLSPTMVAIDPYMRVYQVWMWCSLLLMVSARTARIRRIYMASMKRLTRASQLSWPPIP